MRPGTSPDACAHPALCPGLACLLHPQPTDSVERRPRGRKGSATMFVFPFSGREKKPGLNYYI